jgi:hypothetical protein
LVWVADAFIEASNTVISVTPNSYLSNTDTLCACADLRKSGITRNMDTVMLLVVKWIWCQFTETDSVGIWRPFGIAAECLSFSPRKCWEIQCRNRPRLFPSST